MNTPIFCGQTIEQETIDFYSCRTCGWYATFNLQYDDWDNEYPNSLNPSTNVDWEWMRGHMLKALQNRAKANIELQKINIKIYLHQPVGVEEN